MQLNLGVGSPWEQLLLQLARLCSFQWGIVSLFFLLSVLQGFAVVLEVTPLHFHNSAPTIYLCHSLLCSLVSDCFSLP